MNDHITKPIERKALLKALRRWLPRRPKPVEDADQRVLDSASVPEAAQIVSKESHELAGIDVEGSLQRLGLEFESFQRMIIRFAEGQGATLDALRAAVAAGDSAAAAKHAHAIAGASGNLGAGGLYAAAKALERAGRNNSQDLAQLMTQVDAQAAVVFGSIDKLRGRRAPVATERGQGSMPVEARAVLQRLQEALSDYDLSAASAVLADLDAVAIPGSASDLARLRNHVDSYEYEEARTLAARLLERIGN
jgi:HPt (histidine-containing phosphotransfer) domain-containing protein